MTFLRDYKAYMSAYSELKYYVTVDWCGQVMKTIPLFHHELSRQCTKTRISVLETAASFSLIYTFVAVPPALVPRQTELLFNDYM